MSYLEFTSKDIILMAVFALLLLLASWWAQSFRKKPVNFIKYSPYFLTLSVLVVLVFGSFLAIKGVHLGLEFSGGTIIELTVPKDVQPSRLQADITKSLGPGFLEPQVQKQEAKMGDTSGIVKALIRVSKTPQAGQTRVEQLSTDEVEKVISDLKAQYKTVEKIKVESVGPVIGKELFKGALIAILLGLFFQLIYLTFRFGNSMRYGFAADIGLIHDLILMIGVYSLVGKQVDSPFVAAILTVIGYSVMDSIVIFDRIRENLKLLKKSSFEETVNVSLNETMTRSINTLLTVLLCLFALYFFGGPTLKNFAFSLLIGCTSGAYSSIFIAAPLVVLMDKWARGREEQRVLARREELEQMAKAKAAEKVVRKTAISSTSYPDPKEAKIKSKKTSKTIKKK